MSAAARNTGQNLVQPYAARESSDSHRAAWPQVMVTGQYRNSTNIQHHALRGCSNSLQFLAGLEDFQMNAAVGMMVMLVLATGTAGARTSNGYGQTSPPVSVKCLQVVQEHVKKTRGWDPTAYVVDAEDVGGSGRGFSVLLLAEMSARRPAGGAESFHVDTDLACSRVTGELGYQ
jgi:hypothetical protein